MNDVDASRSNSPSTGTRKDGSAGYSEAALTPPVDVVEDATGITLYADLPGVSKETLHLQVESDTLTIDAESGLSVPKGLQSNHTEVGLGRFRRVFTLSKELDTEKVSAELARGCADPAHPQGGPGEIGRAHV